MESEAGERAGPVRLAALLGHPPATPIPTTVLPGAVRLPREAPRTGTEGPGNGRAAAHTPRGHSVPEGTAKAVQAGDPALEATRVHAGLSAVDSWPAATATRTRPRTRKKWKAGKASPSGKEDAAAPAAGVRTTTANVPSTAGQPQPELGPGPVPIARKPLTVTTSIQTQDGWRKCKAMIDTGAQSNFISQLLAKEVGLLPTDEQPPRFQAMNQLPMTTYGVYRPRLRVTDCEGVA